MNKLEIKTDLVIQALNKIDLTDRSQLLTSALQNLIIPQSLIDDK